MLTVAGLISRIKTIFFSSFQEGQVLRGPELETAPLSSHASHTFFHAGRCLPQLRKQRKRAGVRAESWPLGTAWLPLAACPPSPLYPMCCDAALEMHE